MPLPASLFLQRGRSDSMMNILKERNQQHQQDATFEGQSASSSDTASNNMLEAGIDLDGSETPLYTPPITMTAFDNQYGPHGLLASAMSSSYESGPFTGSYDHLHHSHHPSSASSYPFNPRANLLRRTSSSSTLDSSEDEDEVAWSAFDIERLTAVYEACVEEASFETPFSGPPPSQLLHGIAKACRRAYGKEWPHSITQTRSKALQIAKEKERLENGDWAAFVRRPSVEATPKPPGAAGNGIEAEATPRRKLRRNDSMDFLPESWDLDAVARLSDKLNKSGEDDHSLHQYSYRVRTDTCSSGSDNQGPGPHSAPLHGRLLRSSTYTALNSLEDDSHFSSSSFPMGHSMNTSSSPQAYQEDYSQHPLAQSDPSLQMSSPLTTGSRRPSLKASFDFFGSSSSSVAATSGLHSRQNNTLHHAPSTSSFVSDQSSSLYSAPSLNSSMDTMNLSSFSSMNGEDTQSIYGSSFASSTTSFGPNNNNNEHPFTSNRKRAFTGSMHKGDNAMDSHQEMYDQDWTMSSPFGLVGATHDGMDNEGMTQTPSAVEEPGVARDYFAAFEQRRPSVIHLGPQPHSSNHSTNVHTKKPTNLTNLNTSYTHSSKPPLMKSYTFDAISSKSPTKKYMRMDEAGYNALDAVIPSPRGLMYPNGIGYSGNGGLMLESPFEMDFGATQNGQNQKTR